MLKIKLLFMVALAGLSLVAHAQSGGISEPERSFLINYMEAVMSRLENTLATVTDNEWDVHPADGGWSVAECVEHMGIAMQAQLQQIQQSLESEPDHKKALSHNDGLLLSLMVDRGRTFNTPLPPKGNGDQSRQKLLEIVNDQIQQWQKLAQDKQIHWRSHFGMSPFRMEADSYQMMLLVAGHNMRHTNQIIETLQQIRQ